MDNKYTITIKNYIQKCIEFAIQTKDLDKLDDCSLYSVKIDGSGWYLSRSNEHKGGYDCSWAFKMSEKEITQIAADKLIEILNDELECKSNVVEQFRLQEGY